MADPKEAAQRQLKLLHSQVVTVTPNGPGAQPIEMQPHEWDFGHLNGQDVVWNAFRVTFPKGTTSASVADAQGAVIGSLTCPESADGSYGPGALVFSEGAPKATAKEINDTKTFVAPASKPATLE